MAIGSGAFMPIGARRGPSVSLPRKADMWNVRLRFMVAKYRGKWIFGTLPIPLRRNFTLV